MSNYVEVGQAARTLCVSAKEVLALVNQGTLKAKTTKFDVLPRTLISLRSIEDYLANVPVAKPQQTFIKVGGRCFEEIQTASGIQYIPV